MYDLTSFFDNWHLDKYSKRFFFYDFERDEPAVKHSGRLGAGLDFNKSVVVDTFFKVLSVDTAIQSS